VVLARRLCDQATAEKYHTHRPHSALGYLTPREFAEELAAWAVRKRGDPTRRRSTCSRAARSAGPSPTICARRSSASPRMAVATRGGNRSRR